LTREDGGEFINAHLVKYCEKQKITFTRSRAYKKNDNCFVEQTELKRIITRLQKKLLDLTEEKKFYAMVKDLRYNSEEAMGKMENGGVVEDELAEVVLQG